MAHTFHESIKPCCPCKGDVENLEPGKLLEDNWFFSNILLNRKTRIMSRNNASTSSNEVMSGKSHEETYESIKKLSGGEDDESWPSNLIRAPSLPPRVDKKDQNTSTKAGIDDPKIPTKDLPSMPNATIQKSEECQDEESEFSMGKLIRQASLSNSESFPPRRRAPKKGLTANSSISRHGSITKLELGKLKGPEKMRPQRPMNQLKTQKSLNDLELYRELQGFKDLALDSESCHAQTSDRPVGKKSAEDIKAQIKFWARAVASNVRQES